MKMAIGLISASFVFCFSINKCVLLIKSLPHTMLAYLHWQPEVQTCYDYYHFMIITFFVKENAISYKWTYNWKFKTIFPGLHDWCQFSWLKWNICNPNFTTCGWLKPQSHWACYHVTTYIRPQKKDELQINRWQIVQLILEVVGDHTSKFGRSKADGHVQNSAPVNCKRLQTNRTSGEQTPWTWMGAPSGMATIVQVHHPCWCDVSLSCSWSTSLVLALEGWLAMVNKSRPSDRLAEDVVPETSFTDAVIPDEITWTFKRFSSVAHVRVSSLFRIWAIHQRFPN